MSDWRDTPSLLSAMVFAVGWLAYHYPVLLETQHSLSDAYVDLVRALRNMPRGVPGFGWFRFVARPECLMTGPQLTSFPRYFNFIPKLPSSWKMFSDQSALLPRVKETRAQFYGIGFAVEEFEDRFVIVASYDSKAFPRPVVLDGLAQLEIHCKTLAKELYRRESCHL